MNDDSTTVDARVRFTCRFIAAVQLGFGAAFLLAPAATARLFGFAPAPGWADWLLGMMAARFLGYAYGMALAARDPRRHGAWIRTMIGVQAVDWILTVVHLAKGDIAAVQVPTALVFPVLWIALLFIDRAAWTPRREA